MSAGKAIGGHHAPEGITDNWCTPQSLVHALGQFDLDPCADVNQPWPCATKSFTAKDNGLQKEWDGRVFLNPPYNRYHIDEWMSRLAMHGDGIALTFARTETEWFQNHVWSMADGLYFLRGRINFYTPAGTRSRYDAGGPSVLIAYGRRNRRALQSLLLRKDWPGYYVDN